ncbi:hypothetical protein DSM104299_05825 [Baekduia alba]|uniref:hypothetical protein n=1 Tax=Baekduia alba TaxID=2997333 RepID=UPI0023406081|nr:hypothetical protein [Baekduia alba]WCB97054.1 hypothetical protein DSM104299_05825 [Baekduia alba]
MREGRLATASCTTGWFDWIHRELWLCDDGLLLVRLDLGATRAHGKGPSVPGTLRRRPVRDEELTGADAAGKQLSWIPAGEIVAARGRRGRMADRLTLDLRDGTARKLLWLSVDRADVPLLAALNAWGVAPTSPGAFGRGS